MSKSPDKKKTLLPKLDDKVRIPRNVNFYLHFLQHPEITENDIEWVLQLRHFDKDKMKDQLQRIPNQAFSLFDKQTEFSQKKHTSSDIKVKDNVASCMHLLTHRLGASVNGSLPDYESGLRRYTSEKELTLKEKKWTTVAKKDKHEFPEFALPIRQQIDLKKTINSPKQLKSLVYTGFDGFQNMPPYTMTFQQHNCGAVKHLFAPDVPMSTGLWAEGLRSSANEYDFHNRLKKKQHKKA